MVEICMKIIMTETANWWSWSYDLHGHGHMICMGEIAVPRSSQLNHPQIF